MVSGLSFRLFFVSLLCVSLWCAIKFSCLCAIIFHVYNVDIVFFLQCNSLASAGRLTCFMCHTCNYV